MNNFFNTPVYYNMQLSRVQKPMNYNNNALNFNTLQTDTFQTTNSIEEITRKKFDELFPNGEINHFYDKMNKDFQINNPAKLEFVYDEKSELGGGYTFSKNKIEMNLYDLMSSNKKIVGIKNGQKIPLISPKNKIPLFTSEKLANEFVKLHSQNGNLGFDKLIIEDVTPKEQRKFILQKIAHECVHAKQHQILRETEGIGDKAIIRAWTHKTPKNLIQEYQLNNYTEKTFQNSPWSKVTNPQIKYTKGTPMYNYAVELLNAIQNYPPVDSAEYTQNALEKEAFEVSSQYISTLAI